MHYTGQQMADTTGGTGSLLSFVLLASEITSAEATCNPSLDHGPLARLCRSISWDSQDNAHSTTHCLCSCRQHHHRKSAHRVVVPCLVIDKSKCQGAVVIVGWQGIE